MSKVLYNPADIEKATKQVADHLNSLYNQDNEDTVILAPILQGAVPFFMDIAKDLKFDPYTEFVGVKSYDGEHQKEHHLYKMIDPNMLKGKVVWLFDDVADSGNTLQFMSKMLKQFGAVEVKTCVLLKKRHCKYPVDVYAFEMGSEWIWGYGLDAPNGRGRLLNTIYHK